ncbi:MAG: hypothetical protein JO219_13020 [Candidatus Eremiobacteraeota bacterium]|nr:hypothetical protein [Candidatus Eremiobacteraeota bacterium]MBV8365410.1 hypothetical protein [Candidatus Eremiobacteraeota bacterium]
MARRKRSKAKKTGSRKQIAALQVKLETQRRRAARPTIPVNTHARVSETLAERKRKAERRRAQRQDWDS